MLALFRNRVILPPAGHLHRHRHRQLPPSGDSQNLLDCVAWGIPIEIVPVTLMGLVAPVTVISDGLSHGGCWPAWSWHRWCSRSAGDLRRRAAFHMRESTAPMSAVEAMRLTWLRAVANSWGCPRRTPGHEREPGGGRAGAESFGGAAGAL